MTSYCAMSPEEGLRYLKARDNGEDPNLQDFVRTIGAGAEPELRPIKLLQTQLRDLKDEYPQQLRVRDQQGGRFEQAACEVVHRCLHGYVSSALADHDFWTWLAVACLSDIVEWRFGATGRHAKPANYGIGGRSENLLFRLWLRGELGKEVGRADPYALAKTGDQDLWRAHIIRQGYANYRPVAQTLLKLQAGQLESERLTVDGIRELAKRLRRLRANVVFEFLSIARVESLVLELSADLKKSS